MIRTALLTLVLLALPAAGTGADLDLLEAQIRATIPRAGGVVGVAIKHAESGDEVLVNADMRFPMASTFKLPILVELYYQIAEGRLALDDRLEVLPEHLHVGSGVMTALFDPPGVQLSIRNLINMMMRVSDNSATDMLLARVGPANVTARMRELGLESIRVDRSTQEMILDQSGLDYATYGRLPVREVRRALDAVDPETAALADAAFSAIEKDLASPDDMNRLLQMLYDGEIVDRAASDEIIAILKEAQTGYSRIPGLLPPGTETAHKTGTLGGTVNDVGIVFLPYDAGHLLVSILMKDARADTAARERVIADIVRYAYDYFVFEFGDLELD